MTDSKNKTNAVDKVATLKYKGRTTPIVSAFGENETALEILKLAKKHNVPVYEDESLVQILSQLDVGQAVPKELFEWVAGILAFSFYAKNEVPEGFSPTATRSAYDKVRNKYSTE